MTSFNLPISLRPAIWLFAVAGLCANLSHAEDIVPAQTQSDEQISVWVDDAPLGLFVSQLALITGREASIEGDLEGQVSGRFNGSMAETLGAVSKQFPVLFDLDENTLAAIDTAQSASSTIAFSDKAIGQKMKTTLSSEHLPGNEVEVRENDVVVSGHPAFVKRIAMTVTSLVAENESLSKDAVVPADMNVDQSVTATVAEMSSSTGVVESPEPVTDLAVPAMLTDELNDTSTPDQSESASASMKKPIRWVTDIPGYDTF